MVVTFLFFCWQILGEPTSSQNQSEPLLSALWISTERRYTAKLVASFPGHVGGDRSGLRMRLHSSEGWWTCQAMWEELEVAWETGKLAGNEATAMNWQSRLYHGFLMGMAIVPSEGYWCTSEGKWYNYNLFFDASVCLTIFHHTSYNSHSEVQEWIHFLSKARELH